MIWGDGRWKDSVLSRGHCPRSSSSKLLGYWGWVNTFWNMEVCWGLPVVEMLLAIIIVMVVVFLVPIMAAPLTTILTILVLLTNILRILTINVLLEALWTQRTVTLTTRSITVSVILLEALWTQRTATLTTRPFTVGVIIFSTLARVRHVTNLATSWELTGSAGWHQLCLKTPKRSSKVRLFQ